MTISRRACWMLSGLMLLSSFQTTFAQQTVYKWVDEDGVVHFGETPPAGVDAEMITTSPAPAAPPAKTQVPAQPPVDEVPSAPISRPSPDNPPVEKPVPISEMTLEELDARCEAAREVLIAPLREAEIEKCKSQPRNDPESCERINADYGASVRTVSGSYIPRMFHDIPPCVEADEERRRRR